MASLFYYCHPFNISITTSIFPFTILDATLHTPLQRPPSPLFSPLQTLSFAISSEGVLGGGGKAAIQIGGPRFDTREHRSESWPTTRKPKLTPLMFMMSR